MGGPVDQLRDEAWIHLNDILKNSVSSAQRTDYSCIDNDNDKPIKSLLKGKGLLPLVGLARLDS
jgi:hypothetical protein